MKLKKWNYEKHEYEDYGVPSLWNIKTWTLDIEEEVNCAGCGKKIKFGDCYTSLEIHTEMEIGYAVCEECYNKEWERRDERNQSSENM